LPARAIDTTGASLTFDPFLGSGTTLVAAEQLGRTCYGLEIEPRYVDVIVKRWQNLTGREATLEATGETFAERAGLAQEVPA
jgi:DNA modification methylase